MMADDLSIALTELLRKHGGTAGRCRKRSSSP